MLDPRKMTTDKSKSIARTKKSTISLADILIKEGVTSLVPGAGIVYELGKILVTHSVNFFKDRTERRISEFHEELLKDVSGQEIDKLLKAEFNIGDYHKLLSCCVSDLENEKTASYATFLKNLILKGSETLERRHFIRTLSEATFNDLEFLRIIYIKQQFDLMTVGGTISQLQEIAKTNDTFKLMTISKFIGSGLLTKKDNYSCLTSLGLKFMELVYSQNDLLPEAIGKKRFKDITLYLVTYELGEKSKHVEFLTWLQNELWSRQVKSSIGTVRERHDVVWATIFSAFILFLGDKDVDSANINQLIKLSKYTPVIRVNTTDKAKEKILSDVNLLGEYNIDLMDTETAKEKIKAILDELLP